MLRQLRDGLEHSIVTPFDREDIQSLANALDDVLDEMRAAADYALQHNIHTPLPGIDELLRILLRDHGAERRPGARPANAARTSTRSSTRSSVWRARPTRVYRKVMAELFSGRHDALDILRWKDVVEAIERAIDAVEDASDEVQSIAVKHA